MTAVTAKSIPTVLTSFTGNGDSMHNDKNLFNYGPICQLLFCTK